MYLARVIGRVVATQRYPGLDGVPLQWIQPLDEHGEAMGDALVAATVVSAGPGDLVHFVDGREGAMACPETFVPVDAAVIGYVEEAISGGKRIGAEEDGPHAKAAHRDDLGADGTSGAARAAAVSALRGRKR